MCEGKFESWVTSSLVSRSLGLPVLGLLLASTGANLGQAVQKNAPSVPAQAGQTSARRPERIENRRFILNGLTNPAEVHESLFVNAPELPASSSVTYFLDDQPVVRTQQSPFWMSSQPGEGAQGFTLGDVSAGVHTLRAEALMADGTSLHSTTIKVIVVPSINSRFSSELLPYLNQSEAQEKSLEAILRATSTRGAKLTPEEEETRRRVLGMYTNQGIDPSMDSEHDRSEAMLALAPHAWSSHRPSGKDGPLSLQFSSDAPFYQEIPARWPRVLLPAGYIRQIQLNTNQQGDGIGFGVTIAQPQDSERVVLSQWYDNVATRSTFPFRMRSNWWRSLPAQPAGDLHMIFVDPENDSFISTYKTSLNIETAGPKALFAGSPTKLGTLGDRGGSIAANFAELPVMLQPGEATDPIHPIRHALGGPVARVWAARVYPASAWDAGVKNSTNTCAGKGFTNTGLVPYGGVIQLDPELKLSTRGLSLPALRILEAIQTYGYYVEDFGCADLDIYTAVPEKEFDPYGGLWGYNHRGLGVQHEVQNVMMNNKLYVVAPLVKKD